MAKKTASRQKSPGIDADMLKSLESIFTKMGGKLDDMFEPESALDTAQAMMFDAFEERSAKKRIAIAREALEISPLCVDAYALLARDVAKTAREQITFYRQAIAAGKEALGEDAFKDDVGMFWGLIETRPYMRALHALASILWDSGNNTESIDMLQEMLRLNPNDNQGVRYELLDRLIENSRDREANDLVKAYKNDGASCWAFGRVLLQFRKTGDSAKTRTLLKKAMDCNPFAAAYLSGAKSMPRKLPGFYGMGDENEAIAFALTGKAAWAATEGAAAWLKLQAPQAFR